jgi:glycosyltransferase involved in cell wall biosynthesis
MSSSISNLRRRPDDHRLLPPDEDSGQSWAHVSGWAQLSGSRQTVSCVIACVNQARVLSRLLPILSDTLTECGYPWEMIVVDCGSTDETRFLLDEWSELPGFRWLEIDASGSIENAFATGLMHARGDAVILLDPLAPNSPELIPAMILSWEGDARLVHVQHTASGGGTLVQWGDVEMRRRIQRPDFVLPSECTQLGLIDRELVAWLLQGP